ncbi:MAG: DUF1800 domain-containing protein [Saprospiraceae bacterium]|nr:DUF1800 domain-containing protein [Saprospiraceae bacterium]
MSENITELEKKGARPVVAGLTPYAGTFGRDQIIHLLKRTMFGAKRADIDFFVGKTLAQTLDVLMTPAPTPSLPLRQYAASSTVGVADDVIPIGTTWVYAPENGNYNGRRTNSFKGWWINQMVAQGRSVHEKMILFWHNHFATELVDTTAKTAYWLHDLLRRNALGNLKSLVRDVTFEPNMLIYLNGRVNIKTAPDENYARELQELFTLGKGPNSKYTEDDVKAASRILTGWTIRNVVDPTDASKSKQQAIFNPANHDTGNKQFSSFYGNKLIAGSAVANTQAFALGEFNSMLDMIFATSEVALFISRKLYRHFVYYDIDATVEAEVIAPMADLIRANNYDIAPALKALLSSDHFFELGQKACVIKSPIDFLVGAVREFDVDFPTVSTPVTDLPVQYNSWVQLSNNAALQGQSIGDPPSVAGWPAYYQEPSYHENWINTDTFPKRLRITDTLLTTAGLNIGSGKKLWINVIKFTEGFGEVIASDPNKLIDAALELMYRVPPTAAMRTYLKTTILLGGQASDYYWTDAWNTYKSAPTNTMALSIVTTRLQAFYKFIVQNPEYQLS